MRIFILLLLMHFFELTKPLNIYILQLVKNKYYIGKTSNNVLFRFNQHVNGNGAKWTMIFKPVKIIEHFETFDKFDEDKYTKKYMDIYGIDNVRGGSYTKVVLDNWQIKALEYEFRTANNLCFICGKSGHFASGCKL